MNTKKLFLAAASLALTASPALAQTGDICSQEYISQIVYFDFNAPQTAETQAQIQNIQNIASSCDLVEIEVSGHTDTSGSASYNQQLSQQRAETVRDELSRLGVDPSKITAVGRGETQLFVPTEDGVQETLNRRVEIKLKIRPSVTSYVDTTQATTSYTTQTTTVQSAPTVTYSQPATTTTLPTTTATCSSACWRWYRSRSWSRRTASRWSGYWRGSLDCDRCI